MIVRNCQARRGNILRKILVFGGNGFIGSHLVKEFSKDHQVLVADLNKPDVIEAGNVSYISCDFVRQNDFSCLLQDVHSVFHLVCTILPEDGTAGFEQEIKNNIFSTMRLLENMKSSPGQKLYFFSSGGTVYGNSHRLLQKESDYTLPICKYGFVKDATEKILELYRVMHGIPYCAIRLSNPYGAKMRSGQRQGSIPILVDSVLNNKEFHLWGDGENIRDYIHIDDVVQAVRSLLNYNGSENVFNVGSGKGYAINDVINLLKTAIGHPSYCGIVNKPSRLCDVRRNVLDISLLSECTGWKPKISLEEGIQMLIRQLHASGHIFRG